jgi:hypothetical protein
MSIKIRYLCLICLLQTLSSPVWACAICMTGDPTLNTMGTEKLYAGRLRFSVDYLHRTETAGVAGEDQTKLKDDRINIGLAYAPTKRLNLALRVPVIAKSFDTADLSQSKTHGIGDVEVSARYALWLDNEQRPQKLFGLLAGLRMPSGREKFDNQGRSLDIDVQSGTGLWIPNMGIWYGYYHYPYFFYASSVYHQPVNKGFQQFEAGKALVSTFLAQYALNYQFALQLGIDTRWSTKNQQAHITDPNSGGFIAFLSPGVVYHLTQDVLLNLSVQIPAYKHLHGEHSEGNSVRLGVTYDF